MISGVHAIVFSPAADELRAFFRDTLGLPNVDAGDGWLIFAPPPAELASRTRPRVVWFLRESPARGPDHTRSMRPSRGRGHTRRPWASLRG